ncbi:MAG TPA: hypothetical protein VHM66_08935, partial [Solirubrobacterales bacterium]|nr:hypothetical protein [Solirubrobacterales bacterium]
MAFANTAPLRREIETRLPERPFTVEFWDGTKLPSTTGEGPTFSVRSPRAAAQVLRAPGQLGLGRAYVSGELEVDDIDAVIELLDGWKPPSLDGAEQQRPLVGAVQRGRLPAVEQFDHGVDVVDLELAADIGAAEAELSRRP